MLSRVLCVACAAVLTLTFLTGAGGCYRRVVGVKGAAPGQYEIYEPSVREETLSERRAEERAKAKAEAEKARKKDDEKK